MKKFKRASYNTPPHLSYPAISVVIPLYNAEKYVGECLDSLLAQTFQNFEGLNSQGKCKKYPPLATLRRVEVSCLCSRW